MLKKLLILMIKIPFYIFKCIMKIFLWLFKHIFGFVFGWIPDLDERMSGEEFEEYVKEILIRVGYKNVTLTKKSGDYGVDILAKYKGETYAIQCKLYSRPVGVAAVQQAYSGCEYYGYDKPVVVTNHRFTSQAITLADTNGVELWDGEKLNVLKRKANSRSLFKRYKYKEELQEHEHIYHSVIQLLLEEGYASISLLQENLHCSEEKAFYILEDLEFYGLVSQTDYLGMRDILFFSYEEAMDLLEIDEN